MNDSEVAPSGSPESVPAGSPGSAPTNFEQERLKIEERKVRVDEGRLEIERQRLKLDGEKVSSERKFINRNFATIVTGILSLAAIVVGWAQVRVASISKDKEITIAQLQHQKDIELSQAQQDREWNLEVAKFVTEHANVIFGGTTEQQRHIGDVIAITFPQNISRTLLTNLKPTHPSGKGTAPNPWEEALKELKPNANEARVNFSVIDKNGERLQHVLVEFVAENNSGPYDAMTDNDGLGVVFLPVSTAGTNFRVRITRNDFEPLNEVLSFKPGVNEAIFTISRIFPSP